MDYNYIILLSWWIIPIPINLILSLFSGPGCLIVILLLPICLIIALFLWPPFWYAVISIGIIGLLIEFIKKYTVVSIIIGFLSLVIFVAVIYKKANIEPIVKLDAIVDNNISPNMETSRYDNVDNTIISPGNNLLNNIKNEDEFAVTTTNKPKHNNKYPITLANQLPSKKKHKYPTRICVLRDTNYLVRGILTSGIILVDENSYPYIYIETEDRDTRININVMYNNGENVYKIGVYNWNGKENEHEVNKFKKWMVSNVFE